MRFLSFFRSDLSANVQSLSLWKESEYGMSPAQIQELFPNAQPPSDPNELYGGAWELLRISDVEIVGHKFTSSFYFKNHRLTQVMLSLTDNETAHSGMKIFNSIIDALRKKYGTELSNTDETVNSLYKSLNLTWLSGRTYIRLNYSCIGKNSEYININYNVRLPTNR